MARAWAQSGSALSGNSLHTAVEYHDSRVQGFEIVSHTDYSLSSCCSCCCKLKSAITQLLTTAACTCLSCTQNWYCHNDERLPRLPRLQQRRRLTTATTKTVPSVLAFRCGRRGRRFSSSPTHKISSDEAMNCTKKSWNYSD